MMKLLVETVIRSFWNWSFTNEQTIFCVCFIACVELFALPIFQTFCEISVTWQKACLVVPLMTVDILLSKQCYFRSTSFGHTQLRLRYPVCAHFMTVAMSGPPDPLLVHIVNLWHLCYLIKVKLPLPVETCCTGRAIG